VFKHEIFGSIAIYMLYRILFVEMSFELFSSTVSVLV
jgi:hypothetical protein